MELFLCYRPCFSPTAVTASVSAHLDGLARPASLVVARGSQLEIYAPTGSGSDAADRLRLRASVALFASLVGLHVVTVSGRQYQLNRAEEVTALAPSEAVDLLLLCLAPAKLVLAKFDPRLGRLVPVRLFNLDEGAVGAGAFAHKALMAHRASSASTGDAFFAPLAAVEPPSLQLTPPHCSDEPSPELTASKAAAAGAAGGAISLRGGMVGRGARCAAVLVRGQSLVILPLAHDQTSLPKHQTAPSEMSGSLAGATSSVVEEKVPLVAIQSKRNMKGGEALLVDDLVEARFDNADVVTASDTDGMTSAKSTGTKDPSTIDDEEEEEAGEGGDGDGDDAVVKEANSKTKAIEDGEEKEANIEMVDEEEDDENDEGDVSTDDEKDDALDYDVSKSAYLATGGGSRTALGGAAMSNLGLQAVRSTMGEKAKGGVAAAAQRSNIPAPFTVDLAALGVTGAVRDMCFLAGYSDPTLLILYEDTSSSSLTATGSSDDAAEMGGNSSSHRLPFPGGVPKEGRCAVVAVAFDLSGRNARRHSPHDAPVSTYLTRTSSSASPYAASKGRFTRTAAASAAQAAAARTAAQAAGVAALRRWCVWRVGGLPFDATKLVAAPLPTSGALVLCRHAVLFVDHTRRGAAATSAFFTSALPTSLTNGAGTTASSCSNSADTEAPGETALESADLAQCCFVSPFLALLATPAGRLLSVTLEAPNRLAGSSSGLAALQLRRVAASPLSSCLTALNAPPLNGPSNNDPRMQINRPNNNGLATVFVGSRLGDSLLLQCSLEGATNDSNCGMVVSETTQSGSEALIVSCDNTSSSSSSSSSTTVATDEVALDPAAISKMKVVDLRALLAKEGLDTSGLKKDLEKRLLAARNVKSEENQVAEVAKADPPAKRAKVDAGAASSHRFEPLIPLASAWSGDGDEGDEEDAFLYGHASPLTVVHEPMKSGAATTGNHGIGTTIDRGYCKVSGLRVVDVLPGAGPLGKGVLAEGSPGMGRQLGAAQLPRDNKLVAAQRADAMAFQQGRAWDDTDAGGGGEVSGVGSEDHGGAVTANERKSQTLTAIHGDSVAGARELLYCSGMGTESGGIVAVTHGLTQGSFLDPFVPNASSTGGAPWAVPLPSGLSVSGLFTLSATKYRNEAVVGTSKAGTSTAALVVSGRSLNGNGRTRILAVESDDQGHDNNNESSLTLTEVRGNEMSLRSDVETLALGSLAPSNHDGRSDALSSSCEVQVHAQGVHCFLHTATSAKAAAKVATLAWSFENALPDCSGILSCVNASFGAHCAALLVSTSTNSEHGHGNSGGGSASSSLGPQQGGSSSTHLLVVRYCSASSNERSNSSAVSLVRVDLAPGEPATTPWNASEVTAVSVVDDRAARSAWELYGALGAKARASLSAIDSGGEDMNVAAWDMIAVAYTGGSVALHLVPPPPPDSCCSARCGGNSGGVAVQQNSLLLVRLPSASFGPSSLMPCVAPINRHRASRGSSGVGQNHGMELDGNDGDGANALAAGIGGSNMGQKISVDVDVEEQVVGEDDDDEDDEQDGEEEECVAAPRVVDLMMLALDRRGNGLVSSSSGDVLGKVGVPDNEDPERLMLVLATESGDLCVYLSAELSPCDNDHPTPKAAPITTEDDDDDDIDDEEKGFEGSGLDERWPRTFNRVPQDIVTRGPVTDAGTSSEDDNTTASQLKPVFSPPVLRLWTMPVPAASASSSSSSSPHSVNALPAVVVLCLTPSPAVLAAPRGMPLLAPAQHALRDLVTAATSSLPGSNYLFAPPLAGSEGQLLTAGALIPKPNVSRASTTSSTTPLAASSFSPLVLLRPPPHAAATAAATAGGASSSATASSSVEYQADSEALLSFGGCGAGVAMRKVFLGVRTHAIASLSAKGLQEWSPLRRNLAQAPKVVVLISKPRPREPATVAAKGLTAVASQRANAVERTRLDSDFPPYATSFSEPSTLPSPSEVLPGLEGRSSYAYATKTSVIASTMVEELEGKEEAEHVVLESSATYASVEGPRSEAMPPLVDEAYEVWVLDGSSWDVLERHPLLPGEKGTCLTTATLKPPLKDSNDDDSNEARLYVVVGTAQVSDAGEEVLTQGRLLLFEVGDPSSRGADGPLGPALPVDMAVKSGDATMAPQTGAAAGALPSSDAGGGGQQQGQEQGNEGEEDSEWVGVGPREKEWLHSTAAAVKGARNCMLVPSCAENLDGAALQVVQLSNHLAVAIGAGKEDLGGCARVEVFAFSLLDDLDEVLTGFKAASSMSAGAAGLSSSSSRQQQEVSRFQGLPVGGNGFARKGELKKLTFLETPRVRFVTALQVVGGSYLLVGDLDLSVQLVHWRATDNSLILIGNDSSQATGVAAVGAVEVGGKFSIVVSDDAHNLLALDYGKSGRKGGVLLRRSADFHLAGGGAPSLVRVPLPPAPTASGGGGGKPKKRTGLYFGTADGGAGCVLPVDESVFRRLYSLQIVLSNALPHPAATNPRQHRTARSRGLAWATHAADRHSKRSVLDGSLLWRFVSLDVRDQQRLAHAVGTDAALAIDSLRTIDAAASSLSACPK